MKLPDFFGKSDLGQDLIVRPSDPQMGENFGAAFAACDINGDRRDDLIVGAPRYSKDR